MKPTKLLAAAIACSFLTMPFALGQETETPTSGASPAEEGQSPAASSAESPASKSSEKSATSAEKTPSKGYPTPGSSASPSAAPSAKPTPGTATTAKTSPAGAPVLKGNAEAQIRQIENLYESATMNHNVGLIEPFTGDDFVITDSKARVMNRRAALAEFKKDTDTYTTAKTTDVKVRMVAKDVAVVTGKAHEAGKDKSGKPFDRTFLYTDTFVNRNGKWVVVATHASLAK
jgi:ketosteroid isomerase-like protein